MKDCVLLTNNILYDKIAAHMKGLQHYAFSVMIFNSNNQVLLQRRAKSKYHSGGLWSNACCGHPLVTESVHSIKEEAVKRLQEEMGIYSNLKYRYHFNYRVNCGSLIENEIDYVFEGFYDEESPIPFNKEEVENYRWVSYKELKDEIHQHPTVYTAWFKKIIKDYPM